MLKGCFGLIVAGLAVIGAIALVNADPALPDQAGRAWGWVTTTVEHAIPTSTPAPTARPVTVSPATPPTAAAHELSISPAWTLFDCAFAVDTLREDAILDGRAYADGLSPAAAPYYYATIARQWATDAALATGQCGKPARLSGTAATAPPAQFALAITSHQGDMILHPGNAAWDRQWIAAYTRLQALWAAATVAP